MSTKFRNKTFFILLFLFFVGSTKAFSVPDSLIYKIDISEAMGVGFNGVNISFSIKEENYKYWFFSPTDRYSNALKNADEKKWKNTFSDIEVGEDSLFKGIGWFRLHYKAKPNVAGSTVMLRISHFGASEIFNDGKFIKSFGIVSDKAETEMTMNSGNSYFPLSVLDTLEHVIAIRYSNHSYTKNNAKYNVQLVGFMLRIFSYQKMIEMTTIGESQRNFYLGISMFLMALAFVHLVIYLFEKSRKFNLYHSLFVTSLSLVFLFPVINRLVESPLVLFRIYYFTNFIVPTILMTALALVYNLFQRKINKYFYISLLFYVGALVVAYAFDNFSGFFYIALFFNVFIGATILSIKGIRQNFRGAKIVGFGVLGITVCLILAILVLVLFEDNGVIPAIILAILGILSLPLSMSVYLAYDFAGANKTLKEQIIQIEDLSAKAIREEKEKKEILENQNQFLEEQVKERTAEIAEQNSVLENQKKEITDSITYAKRIQLSILPDAAEFVKCLPQSFVLYMPKDIVSGDFYFLKKKDKEILVAAADCTGHGVPGALMSMVAHEKLEDAVELSAEPGKILSLLNQGVKRTLKQSNADNSTRDGCDIILVSVNKKKISYAGANRNLYIIRKGASVLEEIKSTKCAIGGLTDEEQVYAQHEVEMQEGDSIYLTSDGYADQFGGDKEKKLTTRKFKELLLSVQNLSMENQGKHLEDFSITWRNELEQIDDILVIGIRF